MNANLERLTNFTPLDLNIYDRLTREFRLDKLDYAGKVRKYYYNRIAVAATSEDILAHLKILGILEFDICSYRLDYDYLGGIGDDIYITTILRGTFTENRIMVNLMEYLLQDYKYLGHSEILTVTAMRACATQNISPSDIQLEATKRRSTRFSEWVNSDLFVIY